MKHQHRVVWTKGMFLTPHHFQTQDQFFHDSLQQRFKASQFANWGVTELKIDREGLENGVFRLTECRGVMPDGELFDMPDVDLLPPGRPIVPHFPETARTLDVRLALPERRLQARNVDPAGDEQRGSARYYAETRMITDEHAAGEVKPIEVARRNFRILFGNDNRDGYDTFRIAEVIRDATGNPILNPEFIAPCLNLAHSDYLMRLLRRQIEILANKANVLSGERRQRGKVQADFGPTETFRFWLLHTVNSFLPEVKHLYRVRQGHPEAAYLAMLKLAGALSTFSLEGSAADLPDYDHDNLGQCFSELDARLRDLVDQLVQENYFAIPLAISDNLIWSGTVPEDRYFKDSQFYLSVNAKMGIDDVIRKVPQLVKLTSNDDIHRVIRNALAGVTLRHTPTPPAAIRMKLENQYFSLNQDGRLWESIQLSRTVSVFAPSEIVDPKLELIVVFK